MIKQTLFVIQTLRIKLGLFSLFSLLFFVSNSLTAFELSDKAEISILTCSPGNDLYSAYGHSAIRVKDTSNEIDVVFNYGTFDFYDSNFYTKFALGTLRYMLSVENFESFVNAYHYEERGVIEQKLNLTHKQVQSVFDYLDNNYKGENKYYYYDYFYNNCSSKIRDVFEASLKTDVKFRYKSFSGKESFRVLIDKYHDHQKWGDFGIDLALGLPCDKIAEPKDYVFLPDYLLQSFDDSSIQIDGQTERLISQKITLLETPVLADYGDLPSPNLVFWSLFGLTLLLTIWQVKKQKINYAYDVVLFSLIGLVGILLFFLWFFTDHRASAQNLNILWANPLCLVYGILLIFKKIRLKIFRFFGINAIILLLLTLSFWFLPQGFNMAFLPIILSLLIRSSFIYKNNL